MEPTTVYRLEHTKDGIGPYNSEYRPTNLNWYSEFSGLHGDSTKYPDLVKDFNFLSVFKDFLTGCLTKNDLYNWFGQFLEWFISSGFVIMEYTISHYFIGKSKKQIIFHKNCVINKKPIFDLCY